MKASRNLFIGFFFFSINLLGAEKPENINLELAKQYFKEIENCVANDNGKLWGMKLDSPFMLVDKENGEIVANQNDIENTLVEIDGLYWGKLEHNVGFANTAFSWHGENWTMVVWQYIPKDKFKRLSLFMHELWHSKQDTIGFPSRVCDNSHLDSKWGKILLRLEWRALIKALEEENDRVKHIRNGLMFRKLRREKFTGATTNENMLEMHEGLAEYTGMRLSAMSLENIIKNQVEKMHTYEASQNYIYTFAYLSGSLYGALLDLKNEDWTKEITKDSDFGEILREYYEIALPKNFEQHFNLLNNQYSARDIIKEENRYAEAKEERLRYCTKLFFEKPVLKIENNGLNITFNPMAIFSLGDSGFVYSTLTAKGEWGALNVEDGEVFRATDWSIFTVSAPTKINDDYAKGKNWEIKLNRGWEVKEISDNFKIVKKEKAAN